MKLLILLFTISRLCECSLLGEPVAVSVPVYHGVTVGITPYSAPVNSHSQYHAQDNHGHYAYGYATGLSAQDEVKSADGVTRGGYSYIDAHGILQTVQYISDPVHGFRVAATNLPKDLPEVAAARAQHLAQFEYIKAEHAAIAADRAHLPAAISPVPAPGAYVVPVRAAVHAPAPAAEPIAFAPPVITISSQYHAQDGHGHYSYGYADPNSAKSETKTADGVTRGGYSYIDANGILQTVQYVSDPVNGFRVAATNLPQAPSVTLIGPKVTATVVGPKDNNAAGVAIASDAAIAPSVNAVPVHTYIDSIPVEQSPVLTQQDIVQNANIPVVSPVASGPYLHPNPNHEPVAVLPNSELPAPFQYAAVPPQYSAPIPITHSQAVLHSQQPQYNNALLPPQYANAYPIPHPDGGAHVPSQILHAPEALPAPEYQPLAPEHGAQIYANPIPVQYAAEHRGHLYSNPNVQIPEDNQAYIAEPREHLYAIPNIQVPESHQQAYIADPRGQIVAEDPQGQFVGGEPRGHYLTDVANGAHPITLNPHEVAPSPDFGANYQFPVGSINADTINNGPINQQVLNHGEGPARVALFVPDAVAQQVGVGGGQQQAPVDGSGAQVARPEQHDFIVRVAEHESSNTRDEGSHATGVTAPSGYYTQNIQY